MELTIQLTRDDNDLNYLRKCVSLARAAVKAGDEAFGSVLVDRNDEMLALARNRANSDNIIAHPEIELAQWSLENLSETERKEATMYTSGEHCPMCAAAHGWAGIGTLVYLSSAKQLKEWRKECKALEAPIHFIPVQDILKNTVIKYADDSALLDQIKELHFLYLKRKK